MSNILFTSLYRDANPVRHAELEFCIKKNIENPLIDAIVVLVERDEFPILHNPKVAIHVCRRPTFKDFFDIVNRCIKPDDIAMIANTDIYFDHSLCVLDKIMKPEIALALTRYNVLKDGQLQIHAENTWSQDVWIFQGQIRNINNSNFYMGVRGCDNRINYEIKQAGYTVINPSVNIRCIHYHMSEVRNYGNACVDKPYCGVPSCDIFKDQIPECRINR